MTTDTSDGTTQARLSRSGVRLRRLLVAVGALVLIGAGVLVGVTIGPRDVVSTAATAVVASPATAPSGSGPRIVSAAELRRLGESEGPIYWAGPDSNSRYELSRTATGATFIRYLPVGVQAGSSKSYLTVATYPEANGGGLLKLVVKKQKMQSWTTKSGALVAVNAKTPLSTYFSFSNADFQVETFSPKHDAALKLVLDGTIELISPKG